jgi:hypothetical protein
MRKKLKIAGVVATLALVGAACSKSTDSTPSLSFSPSPVPVSGATGVPTSPSDGLSPSASPGTAGSVTDGSATATMTGAFAGTVTFDDLASPALWSPPPGSVALQWNGPDKQTLGLGGPSFAGQQATSPTVSLSFTVRTGGKLVAFRSTAGECIITITTAEAADVEGLYQCTGVKNADGTLVLNAQGSFGATG